jgi:hypothetical protein
MSDRFAELKSNLKERATRADDAHHDLVKELRTAAIENGNLAVKYLFAVNGGSAIAILGFVGGLGSELINSWAPTIRS